MRYHPDRMMRFVVLNPGTVADGSSGTATYTFKDCTRLMVMQYSDGNGALGDAQHDAEIEFAINKQGYKPHNVDEDNGNAAIVVSGRAICGNGAGLRLADVMDGRVLRMRAGDSISATFTNNSGEDFVPRLEFWAQADDDVSPLYGGRDAVESHGDNMARGFPAFATTKPLASDITAGSSAEARLELQDEATWRYMWMSVRGLKEDPPPDVYATIMVGNSQGLANARFSLRAFGRDMRIDLAEMLGGPLVIGKSSWRVSFQNPTAASLRPMLGLIGHYGAPFDPPQFDEPTDQ